MEKKFEAKLRDVNQVKCPFVKAAFQGKDGNVYIGILLIDTGSVDCILNKSVLQLLDESSIRKNEQKPISSIQSEANMCQAVDFTFKMGNGMFSDVFYVNETLDLNDMFEHAIGIIGYRFLMKNRLVLNYASETLHTSEGASCLPSECEYYFPMEFGIDRYNVPVVGFVSKDKEYVMVADSGANATLLTQHVIDEADISMGKTDKIGTVTCFNNKPMESSIEKTKLCLLSLDGTEEGYKFQDYTDEVQVISQHEYLIDGLQDPDGNDIPAISGLLSSAFMHEHKWILDFGTGIIYSTAPVETQISA